MTDLRVGPAESPLGPSPDHPDLPFGGPAAWAAPTGFPDAPGGRRPEEPIVVGPVAPPPPPPTARGSRVPTVVTFALLAMLVVVLAISTSVARRPEPAPLAVPRVDPVALAGSDDRISFTSAEGSGALAVEQFRWVAGPALAPSSSAVLVIQVRLSSTRGAVSYDPALFQAFDATGELFDSRTPPEGLAPLASGSLRAGESATGWIAFPVDQGPTTLVLSNPGGQAVTALRIGF